MAFIAAGGITVHYDLAGPSDAPVILFANSIGTSFHIWDDMVPDLVKRYRVLRYDMRGHGLTDATPSAYSMDTLADDALSLLDALGIERAHVCGLSIGGMMAQRLAAKAPQRVLSLILCDTASVIGPPEVWDTRIAAIEERGMEAIASGVMARWFTQRFRTEQEGRVRGYVTMVARTTAEGYIGCSRAIRDADLTEDDRRIACPTLVIVGEHDVATPPAQAEQLAATIPGARLAVLPDAAHIPCVERPDAMNALILDFLGATGHGR
ncbi:3-oxoadipate enol-lactonase [Azospirillum canadense]|uniref:3-oxoadipate enol-lactonase n=1 Tax=Azospirillum canadense TaxID=403962 RepID=UPI0022274185|nr:3-oxoadipate enol-lactonase [Azospirillum canadense]MCW2240238.1 3-oxoadipate enol-lactonase [Azospirillum canadense]